jgi:alanyl-tRNA synthetase
VRQGRILGIDRPFTDEVGQVIQQMYAESYPTVIGDHIIWDIRNEENAFLNTVDRALKELQKQIDNLGDRRLAVDEVATRAFNMYQTFGLPVDIFIDELMSRREHSYTVDERQEIQALVQSSFEQHQATSREGSVGMFKGGLGSTGDKEVMYHTVTHLLQQALRDVVGDFVQQRGSNITPERLRFDFTSENRLTPEQIAKVEEIVNTKITQQLPVSYAILPIEEARKSGAIGLFGEKYGDTVKVYSIGGIKKQDTRDKMQDGSVEFAPEVDMIATRNEVYSREFCGGPHVANTGMIKGRFKIQKEEKIARDVVRIKAVLE